jgi:hypothetical protein
LIILRIVLFAKVLYNSIPCPDGKYYISIRAINKVEYGGPLSTTVCHSAPYVIDTSAPFIHEMFDIQYDEETFILSVQVNMR